MKSLNDLETQLNISITLLTGGFIDPSINEVCNVIDPYVSAFNLIHKDDNRIGNFNKGELILGVHLAFWIMQDELHKLPNDPLIFSNLMNKCFAIATAKLEEKLEIIINLKNNLNEEQVKWLLMFLSSKLGSFSMNFSCLWVLLQIWDYLQKQDDFRHSLQRESMS
jgi:hypothetical protein